MATLPGHSTGSAAPTLCLCTGATSLMLETGPQSCVSLVSNVPLLASAPSQLPIFRAVSQASPPFHTRVWQSFLCIRVPVSQALQSKPDR